MHIRLIAITRSFSQQPRSSAFRAPDGQFTLHGPEEALLAVKDNLQKMPEENYSFRPMPGMRTSADSWHMSLTARKPFVRLADSLEWRSTTPSDLPSGTCPSS